MKTAEYRTLTAKHMSEDQLQTNVIELAETYKWWVFHDQDSRRNQAGMPDLVLLRADPPPARLLFVELKAENGRLRRQQAEVIDRLAAVEGVEVMIWKPSHLLSGKVQGLLR